MTTSSDLSEDQKKRIAATLARIRRGLNALPSSAFDEPAHIFAPESFDEPGK